MASFVYDADGGRVKATFGNTTTIYFDSHYETVNGSLIKYYYAGGRRIAMRTGGVTYYLFLDHLGGTHITDVGSNNPPPSRLLYRPWGETRLNEGTQRTTWRFTGQREDATIGLYYYGARYYDSTLGRFVQPDTIVPNPGDPQSLNRYSYTLNNPVRYTDPTGHCVTNDQGVTRGDAYDCTVDEMSQLSWETRKWWLEMFMKESNVNWFHNILGILDYFGGDPQFSSLNGWASLADAGVLVVIQDGWRQFNGDAAIDNSPGSLEASSAWQKFFSLRSIEGDESPGVASQWGLAEQTGVNFGTAIAEPRKAGVDTLTDINIDTFVWFGNVYRSLITDHADEIVSRNISQLDPRSEQSRRFVYVVSKNVIPRVAADLWGLYE